MIAIAARCLFALACESVNDVICRNHTVGLEDQILGKCGNARALSTTNQSILGHYVPDDEGLSTGLRQRPLLARELQDGLTFSCSRLLAVLNRAGNGRL